MGNNPLVLDDDFNINFEGSAFDELSANGDASIAMTFGDRNIGGCVRMSIFEAELLSAILAGAIFDAKAVKNA